MNATWATEQLTDGQRGRTKSIEGYGHLRRIPPSVSSCLERRTRSKPTTHRANSSDRTAEIWPKSYDRNSALRYDAILEINKKVCVALLVNVNSHLRVNTGFSSQLGLRLPLLTGEPDVRFLSFSLSRRCFLASARASTFAFFPWNVDAPTGARSSN